MFIHTKTMKSPLQSLDLRLHWKLPYKLAIVLLMQEMVMHRKQKKTQNREETRQIATRVSYDVMSDDRPAYSGSAFVKF